MNLDDIRRVKRQNEDEWIKYDNVFGVGIGYKTVGGVRTDQISIIVYTTKKRPLNEIPEMQRIPESVEDIPVDVVERAIPTLFGQEDLEQKTDDAAIDGQRGPDENMYRPMVGGIQLCHLKKQTKEYYILSMGTLGMFVKCKNDPENLYILTNWHVLEREGMDIYQPDYDGFGSSQLLVASESRGAYYECADAGIAKVRISHEDVRTNVIAEAGKLRGIFNDEPVLGQKVKKRGRTTYLTHGEITDIDCLVFNGTQYFRHQVMVKGIDSGGQIISRSGDSGSIVLTYDEEIAENNNAVLGILWGGTESDNTMVYSPIKYVFESLNLEMCTE